MHRISQCRWRFLGRPADVVANLSRATPQKKFFRHPQNEDLILSLGFGGCGEITCFWLPVNCGFLFLESSGKCSFPPPPIPPKFRNKTEKLGKPDWSSQAERSLFPGHALSSKTGIWSSSAVATCQPKRDTSPGRDQFMPAVWQTTSTGKLEQEPVPSPTLASSCATPPKAGDHETCRLKHSPLEVLGCSRRF